MEVAVMSLGVREKYTLHSIEYRLSGSDPELASLLGMFTRLTAGEDMPAREKIERRRRTARRSHGDRRRPSRDRARRLRQQVSWQRAGLVIAALLAFALLAAAAVLNGGGLGRGCPVSGGSCAGQLPVRATSIARTFAVK
jgi:hypothetical protein